MDLTTLFFIIIVGLIVLLFLKAKGGTSNDEPSYQKIDTLLTPAERSFFGVLQQAVGNEADIFVKVRLADVLTPKKGMSRGEWQKAFNRISSKHLDFVLCDKSDLSVRCAIELDDKSHAKNKRRKRDEFLEEICQAAGLHLIRFPAKNAYVIDEIRAALADINPNALLQESPPIAINSAPRVEPSLPNIPTPKSAQSCPKCSSALVKKVAKRGDNAGKEFLACSTFPKCRYIQKL